MKVKGGRWVVVMVSAFILLLSLSFAAASGGAQGGGGAGQGGSAVQSGGDSGARSEGSGDALRSRDRDRLRDGTGDGEPDRDRTRSRLETRDRELDGRLLFVDSEGNAHQWRHRFDRRLRNREETGDQEGLVRALHRVANRMKFSSEEDVRGFVRWALNARPWAVEQ